MAETSTATRRSPELTATDVSAAGSPLASRPGPSILDAVHRGDAVHAERGARPGSSYDAPVPLPVPRGPVSAALVEMLSGDPEVTGDPEQLSWRGAPADATTDDDLQLALWLTYELHYRGLAGVDDEWEWHPELLRARRGWESQLVAGLRVHVPARPTQDGPRPSTRATMLADLNAMAASEAGPSMSKYLMRDATSREFGEFLVHRSIYHLKEADPHSWGIPRLSGSVKAAMVTIQADEYGGGALPAMHAHLFRSLLQDWDLVDAYGHYLERVPGVTLLATNLISMFGLHRSWRGALVGHLAMFEMTSSVPNGRYARGHRRLGGGEEAALFFDEHVVADAVHDQIALHTLAGGLARHEPRLVDDIVFGAGCAAYADAAFAEHAFSCWRAGTSSLRGSPESDAQVGVGVGMAS